MNTSVHCVTTVLLVIGLHCIGCGSVGSNPLQHPPPTGVFTPASTRLEAVLVSPSVDKQITILGVDRITIQGTTDSEIQVILDPFGYVAFFGTHEDIERSKMATQKILQLAGRMPKFNPAKSRLSLCGGGVHINVVVAWLDSELKRQGETHRVTSSLDCDDQRGIMAHCILRDVNALSALWACLMLSQTDLTCGRDEVRISLLERAQSP